MTRTWVVFACILIVTIATIASLVNTVVIQGLRLRADHVEMQQLTDADAELKAADAKLERADADLRAANRDLMVNSQALMRSSEELAHADAGSANGIDTFVPCKAKKQ